MKIQLLIAFLGICTMSVVAAGNGEVKLITLEPGHFHAGLVQKSMLPNVNPLVHVYSSGGDDLAEHLQRVEGFNKRAENPTRWEAKVYTGTDFLDRMLQEKAGNVVVLAGNNAQKMEYISRSVDAGLNVLADKPMAITPAGFDQLRKVFELAAQRKVLLYDIMTERYEISTILQRELSQIPEVFGTLEKGSLENPAVTKVSVHHFFKEVAGKPLKRPAWAFDVTQQGEGIVDVTTHLVDLVQWGCFPEQTLDWKRDVNVEAARRWATKLSLDQFKKVTALDAYPEFLRKDVDGSGFLNVFANGEIDYTLRGIHAKVSVTWNFEAPAGAKDTHYSLMRGSRANLIVKQGKEQNYRATLYVENRSSTADSRYEKTLQACINKINVSHPGITLKRGDGAWEVVVPDKYNYGHEAHFAQVMEKYLRYVAEGKLPAWEMPNMIAKYYTTTKAYELSHAEVKK